MVNAWSRSRSFPIGLDLGAAELRMLQFAPGPTGIKTRAAAHREMPPELPPEGPQRRELLIETCRAALRDAPFRGRRAVVNLSHPAIRYHNIRLPKMAKHELAQAVHWEAIDRFGDEAGSLRVQHINAGELFEHGGDEPRQEVILIAIPEAVVNQHLEVFEACGLRPAILEVTPTALASYFSRISRRSADQSTVRVVVDLGATGSRVLILRGCEVVFYRPLQPHGGPAGAAPAATEAAAGAASVPPASAPPEAPAAEMQEPAVEDLARQVDLCLRYYSVSFRGEPPEAIYLCGGRAAHADLPSALTEMLGLEVQPVPALHDVELSTPGFTGRDRSDLAPWAVAAGLALRDPAAPDRAGGGSP